MRMILIAAILLTTWLSLSERALAQSPGLSAWAQADLEKGLAAAQRNDWQAAIEAFAHAQMFEAPEEPVVLFNLGLANAKAGRDLAALKYLHAYLASAPNAPNAAAVRKEIAERKKAAREKLAKIFRTAREGATGDTLGHVRMFQAGAGDIDGALVGEARWNGGAWCAYAETLAFAGLFVDVEKALTRAYPGCAEGGVWSVWGVDAARRFGDFAVAREYAGRYGEKEMRERRMREVEEAAKTKPRREIEVWLSLDPLEQDKNLDRALADAAKGPLNVATMTISISERVAIAGQDYGKVLMSITGAEHRFRYEEGR
jgi:tetratricopeptide (TPR) repeat protein